MTRWVGSYAAGTTAAIDRSRGLATQPASDPRLVSPTRFNSIAPPDRPMTGPRAQRRQRRIRNQDHRCPLTLRSKQSQVKETPSEKCVGSTNSQKLDSASGAGEREAGHD
jgi:hypothetical protein